MDGLLDDVSGDVACEIIPRGRGCWGGAFEAGKKGAGCFGTADASVASRGITPPIAGTSEVSTALFPEFCSCFEFTHFCIYILLLFILNHVVRLPMRSCGHSQDHKARRDRGCRYS